MCTKYKGYPKNNFHFGVAPLGAGQTLLWDITPAQNESKSGILTFRQLCSAVGDTILYG